MNAETSTELVETYEDRAERLTRADEAAAGEPRSEAEAKVEVGYVQDADALDGTVSQ